MACRADNLVRPLSAGVYVRGPPYGVGVPGHPVLDEDECDCRRGKDLPEATERAIKKWNDRRGYVERLATFKIEGCRR